MSTLLGAYLRSRRARLSPDAVGLPERTGRRVAGLRREEVAALAGVSADYYRRLEQGRDQHPSQPVIAALARVLQLDEAATRYLQALAAGRSGASHDEEGGFEDLVPLGTLRFIAALDLPAFVTGRRLDVLAANTAAAALSPMLQPGRNRLRDLLLEPDERARYDNWELATERLVAVFRRHVGADAAAPPVNRLIHELLRESDRFRHLWNEREVAGRDESPAGVIPSRIDSVPWERERLSVEGVRGQSLIVYYR